MCNDFLSELARPVVSNIKNGASLGRARAMSCGLLSEAWHLLHCNEDSFCRYRSLSELGFFRGLWHCVAQPQTELSYVQFAYAGPAGAMLDGQDARAADFVPITKNRGHVQNEAITLEETESR